MKKLFIILICLILTGCQQVKVMGEAVSVEEVKEKKVYEVMLMPQTDDIEISKGGVIVISPEGWKWSDTEKSSYLIVKMELTDEQVNTLRETDERTEGLVKKVNKVDFDSVVETTKNLGDKVLGFFGATEEKTNYIETNKELKNKIITIKDEIKDSTISIDSVRSADSR